MIASKAGRNLPFPGVVACGFAAGVALGAFATLRNGAAPPPPPPADARSVRLVPGHPDLLIADGAIDWYSPARPGEYELTLRFRRDPDAGAAEVFQPADLGWRPLEFGDGDVAEIRGRVRTRLSREILHAEIRRADSDMPARGVRLAEIEMDSLRR